MASISSNKLNRNLKVARGTQSNELDSSQQLLDIRNDIQHLKELIASSYIDTQSILHDQNRINSLVSDQFRTVYDVVFATKVPNILYIALGMFLGFELLLLTTVLATK